MLSHLKAAALSLLLAATATAAPKAITLEWDRNPEPEIAYVVYMDSGFGPVAIHTTPDPFHVLLLEPGRYVFTVTAKEPVWGLESGPSNAVEIGGRPSAPKGLRMKLALHADGTAEIRIDGDPWEIVSVEASQDLQTWEEIARVGILTGSFVVLDPGATGQPRRFWRAVQAEG